MKRAAFILLMVVVPIFFLSFTKKENKKLATVNWITLEEAMAKQSTEPRPILIDLYTDWCGWCKRMDANTFSHPGIAQYISENFYAVKFNAESKETHTFLGKEYGPHSGGRGAHELAIALTNGKLSFPTVVYLTPKGEIITVMPGYLSPSQIEPVLHFIGESKYLDVQWEAFLKEFKSKL